jgi:uncharacterized membrane protein (UPF0127 family)
LGGADPGGGVVGGVGERGAKREETVDRRRPRRLARLPSVRVDGLRVPLATTPAARLVGLALTSRDAAGAGLLIPSCRSIHTFGMRFALDVAFLDASGRVISRRLGVQPRRVVVDRRASAVLEVPSREAG